MFSFLNSIIFNYILENKITQEHLTNYLKHSYKIYKS